MIRHFHSSNNVVVLFNISIEVLNACVYINIYGLSDSEAEIIIIISKKCDFSISAILKSLNSSHIEVSGGGSYQKCEVEVMSSMWKKIALLSGMSTSILKLTLRYLTTIHAIYSTCN